MILLLLGVGILSVMTFLLLRIPVLTSVSNRLWQVLRHRLGLKLLVRDLIRDDVTANLRGCMLILRLRTLKRVVWILLGYSTARSTSMLLCICSMLSRRPRCRSIPMTVASLALLSA